jgi:hypothetical protein
LGHIIQPKLGEIDQGVIFSCGRAEDYEGCGVYGLVITARCDIAHDKATIFNYLPIVELDAWIGRDGGLIVADQLLRMAAGSLRDILKNHSYSPTILDVEEPRKVMEIIFPADSKEKAIQNIRGKFLKQVQQYESARLCLKGEMGKKEIVNLFELHKPIKERIIKDLINQKISGYYFLNEIEPSSDDIGYVILLREVEHLSQRIAVRIAKGIDYPAFKILVAEETAIGGKLDFDVLEFAMPVGKLDSPILEHLMQQFSLLFSRIGVADPDPDYIRSIWERQPSIAKG